MNLSEFKVSVCINNHLSFNPIFPGMDVAYD
jgi:hypothetical protein